jgi:Tfp pilus assembly protein PilZ
VDRWEPAGESGTHEASEVEGVDISSGGVGIVAAHSFRVGEVVKLEYDLNGSGITLPIYSEVVWCQAVDNGSRVGMRFLV